MSLYDLLSRCVSVPYASAGVSANYALQREGQTLYVFFEKSNGANDWKRNLDFPAKPYKRMGRTMWFAHRGFLKVWKELEPILASPLSDPTVKKIVVTGYSHGAAVAMLSPSVCVGVLSSVGIGSAFNRSIASRQTSTGFRLYLARIFRHSAASSRGNVTETVA